MRRTHISWLVVVVALGVCVSAQDNSQPSGTAPAPAFGQNAPVLSPDNPPISGLDEPNLELRTAARSFIAPALQLSQAADTNAGNQFGSTSLDGVTRFLGALDLQKFWSKTDFLAEYLGGGALYASDTSVRQMHAAGAEIVDRWRTGRVTLRDVFSYLPEGTFVTGAYGGMPGLGVANGAGIGGFGGGLPGGHNFGSGQAGSIGLIPRLANTGIVDVVQAIAPKTAITLAGGFSNAHFFDKTNQLINSDQTTVEGGFSHLLSRRDQVGAVYAYQLFRFPQITGGQIRNQIFNLRWGHTITGRLSLVVGVGPEYSIIQSVGNPDQTYWTASGIVQFRYRLQRTSFNFSYEKFTSAGSGFFVGAHTQLARFGVRRSIGRTMEFFGDLGYSHNQRLEFFNGLGASGIVYNEGSAGAVLRKHFGRAYDVFMAYRFGEMGFDNAGQLCTIPGFGACGNTSQRQTGTVGLEWHPAPTRIE